MFGVPMIRLRGGVRQSPDLVRLRAWLSAGQPCLVCLIRDIWGGVLILYEVSFCLTILLPYICKCIVSQLINLLFPQIQSLSPFLCSHSLQSHCRCYLARSQYVRLMKATITAQCGWRRRVARRELRNLKMVRDPLFKHY